MGVGTSSLAKTDLEDLCDPDISSFTPHEIHRLYERFKYLDRTKNGYISQEEFHLIPEFSMNPLADRIIELFGDELGRCNFRTFVSILWVFSPTCPINKKKLFAFKLYDTDGDNKISEKDLVKLLTLMAGKYSTKSKIRKMAKNLILMHSKNGVEIDFEDFCFCLDDDEVFECMKCDFE